MPYGQKIEKFWTSAIFFGYSFNVSIIEKEVIYQIISEH